MKWKPYPEYKDSGVEWLGEVPEGWKITKIRFISNCLDGKRIPLNSEQRGLRVGDVPYWGANSIVDYIDESLFDEELALLGEDGAPFFDKSKPVAFHSKGKVWPNNHVHVLRIMPSNATSFVVNTLNIVDYADFIDGSTRDKLTQGRMNAIPIPWPDAKTRQLISNFLYRETAKLDTLISKQERLIELLQEKRQAIISHAVTKGLDPDVPMKDSGVEWVGEVPKSWEIMDLRRALFERLSNGIFKKRDLFGSGTLLINVYDIFQPNFMVTYENLERVVCTDEEVLNYKVVEGDMFFVRSSLKLEGIAVSAVALKCEEDVVFECHLVKARFNKKKVIPRFMSFLLNCSIYRSILISNAKITTMTTVDQETILSVPCSMPSLEEQERIVSYLELNLSKIDTLIDKARQSIDLAKEHRTALISAAVTGKIDVREAA